MFLVFAACMINDPAVCRVRSIPVYEQISQMGCLMQGQPTLAQWTYDHPEWRVQKWQCTTEEPSIETADVAE
jgi:hypothetical protein